ncbi:hypothetical protein J6590_032063 [Homalodisca vitripennis]|nr:hypothetical protein J6590_032063 [Homalodisca vitripennis]
MSFLTINLIQRILQNLDSYCSWALCGVVPVSGQNIISGAMLDISVCFNIRCESKLCGGRGRESGWSVGIWRRDVGLIKGGEDTRLVKRMFRKPEKQPSGLADIQVKGGSALSLDLICGGARATASKQVAQSVGIISAMLPTKPGMEEQ